MIPRTRAAAVRLAMLCALWACPVVPAAAQTVGYSLSAGAEFRTGCFVNPCVCAPVQDAMTGTFGMLRQPSDPLYAHYDVVGVNWLVQFPTGFVPITGSGTYRVGGTGTVQQQLTLDLSVGGAPVKRFDSGLVPGGGDFPRLDVAVTLHGMVACIDTLLRVRGGPDGATLGVGSAGLSLGSLAPNPFRAAARLAFALRDAGPARVTVHDAAGRCLRTLVDGAWLEAGPHEVEWDGRRADGRACAAGCYFVNVQAGGRTERRSLIKLR